MTDPNDEFLRLLTASTWTKARAARELGISGPTVSRYVSREIKPSIPVLRYFARKIGERLRVGGEEDDASSFMRDRPRYLESWEDDVLLILRKLSPERRRTVIQAMRTLIDVCMEHGRASARSLSIDDITAAHIVAQKAASLSATYIGPGSVAEPPASTPAPAPSAISHASSPHRPRRRSRPQSAQDPVA